MTTKNEYIASIMLEAADLLKSDDLNESIHMMSKDERSAIKNNKKNMKSASIKQLYKAASTGNPDAVRAWANAMKKIVSQTSNNYELYDIGCDLEFSLAKASKRNMPELQRAISAIVQTIKNKLSIPRAMSINDAYDKMTNKSIEDKKNEKMQRKILRGFDYQFYAPHSRYTSVSKEDIERIDDLDILAQSKEAGVYIVASKDGSRFFVTGHPEYDPDTLDKEYKRDLANPDIISEMPKNYYLNDDIDNEIQVKWRSHAYLIFANWLNYYVYQQTPYNLDELKER